MKNKNKGMSRALAPEEIRLRDFVSVLHVVDEYLLIPCAGDFDWQSPKQIRVSWLPRRVEPMKVVEICLPFVLVCRADGTHQTLDVRRYRLARVSTRLGRKAFKRCKPRRRIGQTRK